MKKKRAAVLVLALGLMLAGCGQKAKTGTWNANTNSIYVNHAMEVQSALVYTSETENDTYSQEELKAFAEEAVVDYNTANGGAAASANSEGAAKLPVALTSCILEGKTGTLVFQYATADDFVKFSEENGDNTHTVTAMAVKTVADAVAAGDFADVVFVNPSGKEVAADEVTKQTAYYAVMTEGAAVIQVEGQIAYMTEGISLRDSYTAVTPEGKNVIIFK